LVYAGAAVVPMLFAWAVAGRAAARAVGQIRAVAPAAAT
jgi:hypothetical protein